MVWKRRNGAGTIGPVAFALLRLVRAIPSWGSRRGLGLSLGLTLLFAPAAQAGLLKLTWNPPTTNTDGTPLTDLAGYRLYYGPSSTAALGNVAPCNTSVINVTNLTSFRLTGLTEGAVYFVRLSAVDFNGNESPCSDEASFIARPDSPDTIPPSVAITAPTSNTTLTGSVTLSATAADDVGVIGVQFRVDGAALGTEDTAFPYSVFWDTRTVNDGSYTLSAVARDAAGNVTASGSVPVTVRNVFPWPDLLEPALTNPPSEAVLGSAFPVTDTVHNAGTGSSGSSTTRYYLSLDALRSSADIRLSGSRAVPGLAPGAASTGTATVTIPTTMATDIYYYLLACADDTGKVKESNEANNCVASGTTVRVTAPDLLEPALTNPPSEAVLGSAFPVTDTVHNAGTGSSGSSTTRYYLSLDALRSSADIPLSGSRAVPGLAPGAASTGTATVTIPTSTALGTYYLLACADDTGKVKESNEANNCVASGTTVRVIP